MVCLKMAHNGGGIASKGLRDVHLSRYNKFDAGNDLRVPVKPLLTIPRVVRSGFFDCHVIICML